MPRRVIAVVAAVFAAAALATGCSGGDEQPDTQAAPDTVDFGEGAFNDVPRYPRSSEAGPRTSKDGVVAQSFVAEGASPELVLGWYAENLQPAWRVDEPPAQLGVGTWRGRWARDEHFLIVSATRGPSLTSEPTPDTVTTQYSLSLEPKA